MRRFAGLLAVAVVAAASWAPHLAEAHGPYGPGRWNGGVWFGFGAPAYPAAPYHYPPPHAYPGPYAYGPPPGFYARPAASGGCYAGAYVCPLDRPAVVGMPCSCPTRGGRAWGQAR